jgi:hypothetical protein
VAHEPDAAPPPRVHPDEMARRCFWSGEPRIPSATRIATTVRRTAERCAVRDCASTTWVLKTSSGRGKNKRKLAEPVAVCGFCGHAWDVWDEVNHKPTGAPGSGITDRGRWTRYIHVKGQRVSVPTSTEERLFGRVDIYQLLHLRRLARQLECSRRLYWPSRVYFAYCLRFQNVPGRGGERGLAQWMEQRASGRHRPGHWPRAGFRWNRDRVAALIAEGRKAWALKLERAGLIEGGEWWKAPEYGSDATPPATTELRVS